ncbi:hypothetical protein GG681_00230 [Epibacterium sp. SM1969]|uniref:Uncharacterized protein n=1 Tax=Tritonibacter aquimaris TaxID=2663379 RepID=A0A844AV16_9RHOB|nr:hypothetical protein [Tritonibacter aquimaris]MQY41056.1 hypothetical protein [Tritonibacter aquimaris]
MSPAQSNVSRGLPILRALLVSSIAFRHNSETIFELANSAAEASLNLSAHAFQDNAPEASWCARAAGSSPHLSFYDEMDACDVVETAFNANKADAFWLLLQKDIDRQENAGGSLETSLWEEEPDYNKILYLPSRLLGQDQRYEFWARWYEAIMDGHPLTGDWESHWQLLHDIALIPDEDWQKGAEHMAALIEEIENASTYRVDPQVRLTAERLLRASLGRFSFSEIRHLMEMLPFANDLKELKNQEILESFLGEAEEVTWEIELFLSGLKREELKLQGSGGVLTCFESALEEIGKGKQLASINIGRVIVCGERLQHFSTNHDTLQEFGSYSDGLTAAVRSLQGLTFKFFSEAILRMGVLKDIRSSEEVTLGELFADLSRGFDQIKTDMRDDLVPLAPAAMSVFDTLLDELDGLAKNEAVSVNPAYKSHLRKEFDFNAALVAVSLRLYLEQSKNLGVPLAEVAKGVAISKATTSVEGLIAWLLKAANSTAN